MNLKNFIHRELYEGMTEEEMASAVGVSVGTVADILTGKDFEHPAILRTGESEHRRTKAVLPARPSRSLAGYLCSIPRLNWQQMEQMANRRKLPPVIHAEAMVEPRTFHEHIRSP